MPRTAHGGLDPVEGAELPQRSSRPEPLDRLGGAPDHPWVDTPAVKQLDERLRLMVK
jgi:hypothetical protein